VRVVIVQASRCPQGILWARHFRADGSCDCEAIRAEVTRALRDLDTGPACAPVPHEPHDEYPYPSCPGFVGPEERRWSEEA
jgi:hypothetical protein